MLTMQCASAYYTVHACFINWYSVTWNQLCKFVCDHCVVISYNMVRVTLLKNWRSYYHNIYYASVDLFTSKVERVNLKCVARFSLNVTQHVERGGFPINDEPLIISYPSPVNVNVKVSSINTSSSSLVHTFQDLETSANVTCAIKFVYDQINRRINFNYRDVYNYLHLGCFCSFSQSNCHQFHRNLVYAYLTPDNSTVPYTHCSEIPQEKLVPYHDPMIIAECPC